MSRVKKQPRPIRVNRIGRKLAARSERRQLAQGVRRRPFRKRVRRAILRPMIAYDLETTRIRAGETPRPLYLTACGADWRASVALGDMKRLRDVLLARFLTPENNRCRFVAWFGNGFDVYLVARALIACGEYLIRPYLTRSKSLRGLRVLAKSGKDAKGRLLTWEFLDGTSMTGLVGKSLTEFLETFAPDYRKLEGPDFEREEFNPLDPAHVRYAERDSEGLWHGLQRAQTITLENFGAGLQPTIGNLGIKIFQAKMPADVTIWTPAFNALQPLRAQVMRGGFCHRARRWNGPIWKYDLNQAYAAAMRDARLPAGRCLWSPFRANPYADVYISRVSGSRSANTVPFYYRDMDGQKCIALDSLPETWLTSIEINQLRAEGWKLNVGETFFWDESFNMRAWVNELETLRATVPGGSAGAVGTMVKMIANNAYGKTAERLDGVELVMALECPEGFSRYQADDEKLDCIWYRFGSPQLREYHQPQISAFITAHVRMIVRRAILLAPAAWLYADTDCVAFTEPVTLPMDPVKYGLWKCEEAGTEFYIIEKKVYCSGAIVMDRHGRHRPKVACAKGMNVKRLSPQEFQDWFAGHPPVQVQVQRQNFVKFIAGGNMFVERRRIGQVIQPLARQRKSA